MSDYDLLVIGAGSGGVRAARTAASLGARVAICEERYLGGTCVNVGCVPKKLLVHGSHFRELFEQARGYGWQSGEPTLDWARLRANKDREIERLNGVYERLLSSAGVTLLEGHARITGPGAVEVAGQSVTADRLLIAVGGWPYVPQFPGREHVISSNEVFYLDELPEAIAIVGGGYIAAEFAGIFNGLGVETHLIYRRDLFLRGFDRDLREHMAGQMRQKGIHLHFDTDVKAIERGPAGERIVKTDTGQSLSVGQVLYATGRRPKLDNLGLENTRAQLTDTGAIAVDERYQTAEPGLYAIGDVTGRLELTPVALAEGMFLAHELYGQGGSAPSYDLVPTAVFTQPNMATVGLSEDEAHERDLDVDIYRTTFRPLPLTLTDDPEKTLMKLVVDKANDRVLGCHMAGPEAGEIVQGLAVALNAGATKADFDRTVGIHPTLAEEFVTMRAPS